MPNFRDAPPAYVTASNSLNSRPVFYVSFGLVVGPLGTNSQVLPDQYRTGPIANPTQARKKLLDNPTSVQNDLDYVTSETSISSISFNLSDVEGDITRIVTNYTMKNRLCTIYAGYEGFTENQFIPIYSGQINNWVKTSDGTTYVFTVTDALKQLKQTILEGHTQLTQNFNPTTKNEDGSSGHTPETECFVTSTEGFASSTDLHDGLDSRNYIRINDSLYSYDSISDKSFIGLKLVQLNSNGVLVDEIHQSGENVDNYVLYRANPIDLILEIALSTGNGTNGDYDVLPEGQGIGIPEDLINVTNFERQRSLYASGMVFGNFYSEKVEALKFINEEILRQVNAYLYINRAGQLDIKMYYVPVGTIDAVTLTDREIIGTPDFNANLATGNAFFNEIDMLYDYQPVRDFYVNELLVEDLASQQKYEERATLKIDCKMLTTYNDAVGITSRMKSIYLSRFSDPPPLIGIKTYYGMHLINPGDSVYLDSSVVPNYITGREGGPTLCECISVGTDFSSGIVTLVLLGIGFNNRKRYAGIAPDSVPVYGSATDGEKLAYVFICEDTEVMSNGDQAYLVTP